MLIQNNGNYKLNVELNWLESELIRVAFRSTNLGIEYTDQEYYLLPEELATLADYINDTLAR